MTEDTLGKGLGWKGGQDTVSEEGVLEWRPAGRCRRRAFQAEETGSAKSPSGNQLRTSEQKSHCCRHGGEEEGRR